MLILLVAPIVPAILFDDRWNQRLREIVEAACDRHVAELALLVGGLLAVDIFLPLPSGSFAVIAGASLGFLLATLSVWGGLAVFAALGFAAARFGGEPVARRLAGPELPH